MTFAHGGEMLAGRLFPLGNRPEVTGTTTGLGKASCELWLCSSPGHIAHAMGRRCQSGDPPGTATASKWQGKAEGAGERAREVCSSHTAKARLGEGTDSTPGRHSRHPPAPGQPPTSGSGCHHCPIALRPQTGGDRHSLPKQIQAWVSSSPSNHSHNTQPIC